MLGRDRWTRRGTALLAAALAAAMVFVPGPAPAAAQSSGRDIVDFVRMVEGHLGTFMAERYHHLFPGGPRTSPPRLTFTNVATGPESNGVCFGRPALSTMYCRQPPGTVLLDVQPVVQLWDYYGDFALVTVMAHEFGHHRQAELGLLGRRDIPPIRLELGADCYAGQFAQWAKNAGRLEPGDLNEGTFISMTAGQQGNPATHGDGPQRAGAFLHGFERHTAEWPCGWRWF
jgi:uncharacterized protein